MKHSGRVGGGAGATAGERAEAGVELIARRGLELEGRCARLERAVLQVEERLARLEVVARRAVEAVDMRAGA
jgi:hypothetical protein